MPLVWPLGSFWLAGAHYRQVLAVLAAIGDHCPMGKRPMGKRARGMIKGRVGALLPARFSTQRYRGGVEEVGLVGLYFIKKATDNGQRKDQVCCRMFSKCWKHAKDPDSEETVVAALRPKVPATIPALPGRKKDQHQGCFEVQGTSEIIAQNER